MASGQFEDKSVKGWQEEVAMVALAEPVGGRTDVDEDALRAARPTMPAKGAAGPVPWDGDAVRRLVREAVRKKWGLFKGFADVEEADVVQVAMLRAAKDHRKFDPNHAKRAKYSTWITRLANFAILDCWRKRGRQADRDHKGIEAQKEKQLLAARDAGRGRREVDQLLEWIDAGESAGLPGGEGGNEETLAEWLARVYVQAVRAFPKRRGKRGRNWFTPPQIVCAALLMRKRRLSRRGAQMLLQQDEDLRKALRLRRVPHWTWFGRAEKFATDNLGLPDGE